MRPYVKQGQELPPGGVDGYAPMRPYVSSKVVTSSTEITILVLFATPFRTSQTGSYS